LPKILPFIGGTRWAVERAFPPAEGGAIEAAARVKIDFSIDAADLIADPSTLFLLIS